MQSGVASQSFVEMLATHASRVPDKPFLQIDGSTTTFQQAAARVTQCTTGLLALGIQSGDVLATFVPTCQEAVDLFLASPQIGTLFTPINIAFHGDFLRHQLVDSGTVLILIEPNFVDRLVEVADQLTDLRVVVVRGSAEDIDEYVKARLGDRLVVGTSDLYLGESDDCPTGVPPGTDTPAYLFYTSGTTGLSKGVVITESYLVAFARTIAEAHGYRPDDVIYGAVPLFHVSGTSCVLISLVMGATTALDSEFHPRDCWQRVRDTGATAFIGVGAMLTMLWRLPPSPDDATLPLRLFTAAPIPAELHHRIEDRYGFTLVSAYGLTEAMPIAVRRHDQQYPPGSAGRPNPAFEVALVNEEGTAVADGAVGEIACRPVRGRVMFEGYLDGGAVRPARDADGWFRTGDLGRLDSERNLFFVDRKNYAIRRRGENISSFEIEQTVSQFPGVVECAATGVPSDLGEDDVKISVVFATTPPPPEDLYVYCTERMPRFAVPRYIEYLDVLPKNAVGRVQKFQLVANPVTAATWDREAVTQHASDVT